MSVKNSLTFERRQYGCGIAVLRDMAHPVQRRGQSVRAWRRYRNRDQADPSAREPCGQHFQSRRIHKQYAVAHLQLAPPGQPASDQIDTVKKSHIRIPLDLIAIMIQKRIQQLVRVSFYPPFQSRYYRAHSGCLMCGLPTQTPSTWTDCTCDFGQATSLVALPGFLSGLIAFR